MPLVFDVRFSERRRGCERLHSHGYSVVTAVEGGGIVIRTGARMVTLKPGSICFIPAGVTHQVVEFFEDFSGVYAASLSCSINELTGSATEGVVVETDGANYSRFVNLMKSQQENEVVDDREWLRVLSACFQSSGTISGAEVRGNTHWIAKRIKEVIDTDSAGEDCFDWIQREIPFSKEHCNRLFKAAHGLTIQSYSLNVRVEKARALLAQGLPLADVAVEAGFYDQSQLTKAFMAIFQLTPGEYQEQAKSQFRSV